MIYIHIHILQIKLEYKINNRIHAKYMYSKVYHITNICNAMVYAQAILNIYVMIIIVHKFSWGKLKLNKPSFSALNLM